MENNHHLKSAWSLLKFWTFKTFPMWFLIGLMIFLMQLVICGIIRDNKTLTAMLSLLDLFPIAKTALGGDYLQAGNIEALMTMGYKHPFILFLYMFFAVSVPTGLLTGEVQRGTMELILSRQISKLHVYLCAGLISVIGMFALVIVMFLGTVTSIHIYDFGRPIALDMFFRIAIDGGLFASTCGAIALLSAAIFKTRNFASGIAVAFLVINYFTYIISQWWERFAFLKGATLFNYVGRQEIMESWPIKTMPILGAVFLIAFISGAIVWKKRDLPL